jgi:hypothetical protein
LLIYHKLPATFFPVRFSLFISRKQLQSLDSYGFNFEQRKPGKWSEIWVMRAEEITLGRGYWEGRNLLAEFALHSGASPQNSFLITCLSVAEIQERLQCMLWRFVCRDVTSLIRALRVCSYNPHMPSTMATHDQPLPGRSARDCCCYILHPLHATSCQLRR